MVGRRPRKTIKLDVVLCSVIEVVLIVLRLLMPAHVQLCQCNPSVWPSLQVAFPPWCLDMHVPTAPSAGWNAGCRWCDGKFFRLTGASPRRPPRIASKSYARRCCNQASPNIARCQLSFGFWLSAVLLLLLLSFVISPRRKSTIVSFRRSDHDNQLKGVASRRHNATLHIVAYSGLARLRTRCLDGRRSYLHFWVDFC